MRHIPSRLNVLADSLSLFKPLSTEWQLDPTLQSSTPVVTDIVYQSDRDLPQYPTPAFHLPISRRECGRGRGAFPAVGVHRSDVRISADATVNSVTRQDMTGPSASAGMAQTTVVQFSRRTVSHACGASPPRSVPPPAGELDTPLLHRSMIVNGPSTVLGVHSDRSILSISL